MSHKSLLISSSLLRQDKYDLISILKKREIFKDIHMNRIGSQNINLYLNEEPRTIFSILKLEDNRLPLSSLSTIFPLFIVQKLGHRPVLILDDRKIQNVDNSSTSIGGGASSDHAHWFRVEPH